MHIYGHICPWAMYMCSSSVAVHGIYRPTDAIPCPFGSAVSSPVLAQSLDLSVTMQVPGVPCEACWPLVDCLCNPASSACPAHRSASGAPAHRQLDWKMVSMQGNCRLHASRSVLCYQDNCKFRGGVVQDVELASPGKLCLTSPLNVSSSLHASSTALPSFVLELRESKAPPGTCAVD